MGPQHPLAVQLQSYLFCWMAATPNLRELGECLSPILPALRGGPSVAASWSVPYFFLQQCAAVSTQFRSTRTPAHWNWRLWKRETCQGCEPRVHGTLAVSRSTCVAFPGSNSACAAG